MKKGERIPAHREWKEGMPKMKKWLQQLLQRLQLLEILHFAVAACDAASPGDGLRIKGCKSCVFFYKSPYETHPTFFIFLD
jgi:hypothetical protein